MVTSRRVLTAVALSVAVMGVGAPAASAAAPYQLHSTWTSKLSCNEARKELVLSEGVPLSGSYCRYQGAGSRPWWLFARL